jgi:hypothetical protein
MCVPPSLTCAALPSMASTRFEAESARLSARLAALLIHDISEI